MGILCNHCGTLQPIKRLITTTGEAPRSSTDVIGYGLGCGFILGGERYREFVKERDAMVREAEEKKLEIDRELKEKVNALWKKVMEVG